MAKRNERIGDAIRYARNHVGNEPFAVLLGDTLISGNGKPIIKQLMDVFDRYKGSVVALEEVDQQLVNRNGIISGPKAQAIFRCVERGQTLLQQTVERFSGCCPANND